MPAPEVWSAIDYAAHSRRPLEHAVHDSVHHLDDVAQGLTRLRAGNPSS